VRALPFLFWIVAAVLLVMPLLRRRLPSPAAPLPSRDELVKDPVCQTYVVRSRAVAQAAATGVRYFCSAECARRYAAGARG
jgi:YHS domain-containing protein